jgi:hypothetical protein
MKPSFWPIKGSQAALFALLGSLLIVGTAWAFHSPQRSGPKSSLAIPYPGRLNDALGQAVPDGLYDFRLTAYAEAVSGEPIWSETHSDVAVTSGIFAVSLGSLNPIPLKAFESAATWLEVAVRASGDKEYTLLSPRLQISLVEPASPSNPTSGSSCAHDHLGETWNLIDNKDGLKIIGSVSWSNSLLSVTNHDNGPSIWGMNDGGGNGVRGQGGGTSIGVYGQAEEGIGVAGNSSGSYGVSGTSSASGFSGVYGYGEGYGAGLRAESEWGLGVYGIDGGSNPDDSWAVWSDGDTRVTGDATVGETLAKLATWSILPKMTIWCPWKQEMSWLLVVSSSRLSVRSR